MKIVKGSLAKKAVNFLNGNIDAIALNDLWERYELPGFNKPIFELGKRADGYSVSFGQDDAIQAGIFGVIAAIGVMTKNKDLTFRGLGGISGTITTKAIEFTNHTPPRYAKKERELSELA